jgi:hypothetical protein
LFLLQSFLTFLRESILAENILYTDIIYRPVFLFLGLLGAASGVSAFVTGLIDIIKNKEHVFLVFGSTLVGTAVIVIIFAFLFP